MFFNKKFDRNTALMTLTRVAAETTTGSGLLAAANIDFTLL
jgi:hypothetical protein